MSRAPRLLALILPLGLAACSGSPAAPTPARVPPAAGPTLATFTYTINIPDRALTQQLLTAYPTGRLLSPVAAQAAYDFTEICHGYPNVYYGALAPADGSYYMGAIVVAPYAVASVETFPASAWPNEYGQFAANTTYQWLGRFVYYNCETGEKY
jgi:hypothetical protein